ncbi:hypothetical protein BJ875DRAFT_485112 [Amylocarpus encephaloides]|uniref:SprT-like domain-containing protein n=1 Tax=Amylocarpus encephaloides TaxID=45428 RepID=A0A9P8C4C2_9HELO|nr:hypothetical protein BJ875DRAFT_485112 [Amylocarpus encephaloides]
MSWLNGAPPRIYRNCPPSYLTHMVSLYANAEISDMGERQQVTNRNIKATVKSALQDHNNAEKEIDYHTIFEAYLGLFDQLFFFESFRGLITLVLSPEQSRKVIKLGNTTAHLTENNLKFTITLYQQTKKKVYPSAVLERMIATLLHEMVHAFVKLYSCPKCSGGWENDGIQGHGMLFLDIVAIASKAARTKGLLTRRIPLEVSLARELRGFGMSIPDAVFLENWEIDRTLLDKSLGGIWEVEKILDGVRRLYTTRIRTAYLVRLKHRADSFIQWIYADALDHAQNLIADFHQEILSKRNESHHKLPLESKRPMTEVAHRYTRARTRVPMSGKEVDEAARAWLKSVMGDDYDLDCAEAKKTLESSQATENTEETPKITEEISESIEDTPDDEGCKEALEYC